MTQYLTQKAIKVPVRILPDSKEVRAPAWASWRGALWFGHLRAATSLRIDEDIEKAQQQRRITQRR
jgi:hypothetical protein